MKCITHFLTAKLLDFYKKVNNMEIPQFDVISKFEDYAKSIRICVDLCQVIPDDYSNGKRDLLLTAK